MSKAMGVYTLCFVVVVDQVSKALFPHVVNPGISFGLFQGPLLTGVLLGIYGLLCVWWWRQGIIADHPLPSGLILGGGLSNLIDRGMVGGVRDPFRIPLTSIWNNLADWAIAIGCIFLMYEIIRAYDRGTHTEKRDPL